MSNRKKRSAKRTRRTNTTRHALRLEGLESRKLMAAAIMDSAFADQTELTPAAFVSSATGGVANNGVIPFIVNGQQTSGYESVGIVNGGCTGTLISPTHVLTAAHCVEGSSGGFIGNREGTFEVNGQTYKTVKVTPHPDYDPNNFAAGFDLAIMELDRPVEGVNPSEINRTAPQVGQTMTLVGFGEAGTSSNPSYGFGVKHVGTTPIESITNEHISWVLDSANEAATAPGDSGGPAFINVGGKLVVAGVTSGGSGDSHSIGAESFDTRVDTLASWIDAQVGTTTPVEPVDPVDPIPPVDPVDPITPVNPGGDEATELANQELADYDTNGNGALSLQELTNEFLDLGDSQSDAAMYAEFLIEDFDANGDGELNLSELIVSWGGEAIDDGTVPVTPVDPIDPVDPITPVDPVAPGNDEPTGLAMQELADYDTDGNGALSLQELTNEFIDLGDSNSDAAMYADFLIQDFDASGDEELNLTELIVSWGGDAIVGDSTPADPVDSIDTIDPIVGDSEAEQLAMQELDMYDTNNDGSLSVTELTKEFADQGYSNADAKDEALRLINEFDVNADNSLSLDELVTSWNGADNGIDDSGDGGTWNGDGETAWDDSDDDDFWSDETDWWSSAFMLN